MTRGGGGDEGCNGGFVCSAGCYPGQGEFFASQGCGGGLKAHEGAFSPGGTAGVAVDLVAELGLQAGGDAAELLAAGLDGVRQGACQVGHGVDGGRFLAKDVAYGALAGVFLCTNQPPALM